MVCPEEQTDKGRILDASALRFCLLGAVWDR
jgi:hypothetical protein